MRLRRLIAIPLLMLAASFLLIVAGAKERRHSSGHEWQLRSWALQRRKSPGLSEQSAQYPWGRLVSGPGNHDRASALCDHSDLIIIPRHRPWGNDNVRLEHR